MNKNPIVSLQIAKLAKEKGYEGKGCKNIYANSQDDETTFQLVSKNSVNGSPNHFPAPDRESLQRWLRKRHDIRAHVSDEGLLKGLQQIP